MANPAHSTLGASSAHRWMECPGSIKLSEGMPNESSIYAREGNCAHDVAEACLVKGVEALHYLGCEMPGFEDIEVDEDMCASVQIYVDCVRDAIKTYTDAGFTDYELDVEVQFDLSHVHPDMFGTCDAVLYFPAWKKLVVHDYKHGWVAVAVEKNKQTLYYGVGALTGKHNRPVEEIELVIVQPNSSKHAPIKRWSCDALTLLDFIADLKNHALKTESANAELRAGEWCKYCPAKAICRTLANKVEQIAMAEFDNTGKIKIPAQANMTPEQLAVVWENASLVEEWVKGVKAFAHQLAVDGSPLPGTRLVRGRKGHKKWKDPEEAQRTLEAMVAIEEIEADIYVTKLKTPAQLEKEVAPAILEGLYTQSEGKMVLVKDEDDRPDAKVAASKEFL